MEGRYRVTTWGNIETGDRWYGLWFTPKGKRKGMPVCEGDKPLFFETKSAAEARAKELNGGIPAEVKANVQ